MARLPDMNLRDAVLRLTQIHRRSLERRARAQIIRRRRALDIQHLVVFAQLGALALDAHVKQKRENGGQGSRDGEGGNGLVETTDHDAGFVVPGADDAAVAEGPG